MLRSPGDAQTRGSTMLQCECTPNGAEDSVLLMLGPKWAPCSSVRGSPHPGDPRSERGVSPARLEDENSWTPFLASRTFSGF